MEFAKKADNLVWHCLFCMSVVSSEGGREAPPRVLAAVGEIGGELQDFAQALTFPWLYISEAHCVLDQRSSNFGFS